MAIFNDHLNDSTHDSKQASLPETETGGSAGWLRLAVPCMALLITLGWFGYAIYGGTEGDAFPFQLASSRVQHKPAASFQTLWVLQLPEDNQNMPVNPGAAGNGAGPAAIAGDAAVQAGWIKNLTAKLVTFGGLGSQWPVLSPDGSTAAPLPSTQLPQFVTATLLSSGPADIKMALSTPAAGQSGKVPPGSSEIAALQSLSIDFPANSAKIPPRSIPLVKRAAGMIKQLPAGTIVELAGYTASTSNSIGDSDLSRRRAESVYEALADLAVNPAILSAKGLGRSPLQRTAGTATEGRSSTAARKPNPHDRRVEFHVVPQPR